MPELPELTILASQMRRELTGKRISRVECFQPKCSNVEPSRLDVTLSGRRVGETTSKGKWLFMPAENGCTLLINLGMGADMVRFVPGGPMPPKYQFRLDLEDGTGFTIRFWWFGYVHLVLNDELQAHAMTRDLGPSPLDPKFTADDFRRLVRRGHGMIKPFLLDQRHVSGIGNAYVHDILFRARIHPRRPIPGLSDAEIDALYASVRDVLGTAIVMGGAYYEKDFYGHPGGYTAEHWLVGYADGRPCTVCGATIRKIKTGSTSSYICPSCQPL
ncbi:MAG TPA: DNA-formamidopyrimidine glycosylase family protein [Bacillota bacterium]|jgi:formamidopyrimidine-DNA glycosylase|nr:DNA-formamidopyrimidine glycosylase family protein [Bacillota bacterium]